MSSLLLYQLPDIPESCQYPEWIWFQQTPQLQECVLVLVGQHWCPYLRRRYQIHSTAQHIYWWQTTVDGRLQYLTLAIKISQSRTKLCHKIYGSVCIFGSGNGVVMMRQQAISWVKDDHNYCLYMILLCLLFNVKDEIDWGCQNIRLGLNVLTHCGDKSPTYRRWQFQIHFLEWRYMNCD